MKLHPSKLFFGLPVLAALICLPSVRPVVAAETGAFLPTWKLMSAAEKQYFVAGYLQGFRDAGAVTDITLDYVKANPKASVAGLEAVKKVYDLGSLRPEDVVQEVDQFFSRPENSGASLPKAISAARTQLN
jgi:hypothetical protein